MKALVLTEYNNLQIQDVPQPDCRADDVLLRVRACGICGSDIHGMDGSTGRRRPPIIMGHEAAGEIASVGSEVQAFETGDRVTFDSTVYCGQCPYCVAGDIHLCDNRRVLGVSCEEYRQHGAFAEYVAVPARILYRLPDAVDFERAALVEPTSIAFHAVHRMKIQLADTAVVVGTGMVGLLVVQALQAAGCGQLIAVDIDPHRLRLACELGADVGLDPHQVDVPSEVARLTGGRGADVAAEVVGTTATVQTAVHCLRKGGQLSLVGNLSPNVELPLQAVVTRELSLLGSCASRGDYPACLDMIARGKIRVDPLISATAPLDEGAEWFQRLYAGEEGMLKVVLQP
jgi:L-iditol 2-dehydrogenase